MDNVIQAQEMFDINRDEIFQMNSGISYSLTIKLIKIYCKS